MKEWQELGKELRRFINPETFPVAIKILETIGEIPSGTRVPLRDLRVKLAHCQAQTICRKYGWTLAMTKEDLGCAISGYTYGWEPVDQEDALHFFIRMNYAKDTTVALNLYQSFRCLKPGQCDAVVYSPLEWTKIEPDVILIYLNPAQLMRCLHGSTHLTGRPIISSFSGRAASCSEGVLGAFLDQLPKVVIPGNGDRVWAAAQDHEMAYALPASHLKDLIEGLARTHEKGIRYPIPTFLRYQPEVGLTLPLTDIFKPIGEKMNKD
ncbi:MAG: DUF169 domain-containing protein [Syntrophaceae bacterium]|nr:DUF169 domain-containing protein [Syntrophaceae bacterium]